MTKSWRDVLKVHPAADLFPMMSLDELKALGEDIKKNGLRAPIVLWAENHDGDLLLLDGRNRLDAAELAGVAVVSIRSDKGGRVDINVPHRRLYGRDGGRSAIDGTSLTADPYEFVLSANVHRRHLTGEQKRELIAKVLKAQPGSSKPQDRRAHEGRRQDCRRCPGEARGTCGNSARREAPGQQGASAASPQA